MSEMFYKCGKLSAVYVGPNWYEPPTKHYMFKDCGVSSVTQK
jgi:hypothetical protein